MRLLDTSSLQLKSFADDEIPKYTILSHTWGDDEVSFQEMQHDPWPLASSVPYTNDLVAHHSLFVRQKAGYAKIRGACRETLELPTRLKYIWIDTCCIDKTSSAELSEAINSMYKWYQNAEICIVYLSDVPAGEYHEGIGSKFESSRWFTRGWTLQELIASRIAIFYSQGWQQIGTKEILKHEISKITGVDIDILTGDRDPRSESVAMRMFWASDRQTTRQEDIAYCLMGLFDVNMPLLYGEGNKAFNRLQEEIMRNSDDHSLFAWKVPNPTMPLGESTGLLSPSPHFFKSSRNIVPIVGGRKNAPYSMTNRGLRIDLSLIKTAQFVPGSVLYIAPLNCTDTTNNTGPEIIILVRSYYLGDDQYMRLHHFKNPTSVLGIGSHRLEARNVSVLTGLADTYLPVEKPSTRYILEGLAMKFKEKRRVATPQGQVYGFQIRETHGLAGYRCINAHPPWRGDNEAMKFSLAGHSMGVAGLFLFENQERSAYFFLMVGIDSNFLVAVRMMSLKELDGWKELTSQYWSVLDDDVLSGCKDSKLAGIISFICGGVEISSVTYGAYGPMTHLQLGRLKISVILKLEIVGKNEIYVVELGGTLDD